MSEIRILFMAFSWVKKLVVNVTHIYELHFKTTMGNDFIKFLGGTWGGGGVLAWG